MISYARDFFKKIMCITFSTGVNCEKRERELDAKTNVRQLEEWIWGALISVGSTHGKRKKGGRVAPSAARNAPAPRAHQWGPHVGRRAGLIERSARPLAELVFRGHNRGGNLWC
jgi:hypothetical protein